MTYLELLPQTCRLSLAWHLSEQTVHRAVTMHVLGTAQGGTGSPLSPPSGYASCTGGHLLIQVVTGSTHA